MDGHVKDVAAAEVGRRTLLLRRGLEQQKAANQSRFNHVHAIQENVQSDINILMSAADHFRLLISDVQQEIKSSMNQTAELLSQTEDEMNTHLNEKVQRQTLSNHKSIRLEDRSLEGLKLLKRRSQK
ncbi:hypothetical protein DPMN_184707 [Dreissena polymorpha]|uniref:Uncharacterized protein n=1 Tax=Dreissena polymorpha TaxID=45954 RepID=A0A9D4I7N4_DREPO|nr:hypothetical protein DPMN_184707 [Dreissena polymorpha]